MPAILFRHVLYLLLFQCAVMQCAGLTNVTLRISRIADQVAVSWNAKSTVPQNIPVFPDYYLEISGDLQTWDLVQSYRSNSAARVLTGRIPLGQRNAAFLRVRSVLDLSGRTFFRVFMPNADFRDARIVGADFFSATLTAVRFADSDLTGTDFRFVSMPEADFRRAKAFAASFIGANLRGSDLRGADFSFADLTRADLSASDLSFADLRFALLTDADLNFAFLRGVKIDEHTLIAPKWRTVAAVLNSGPAGLNLKGMDLSFAIFIGADLRDADLRGTDLRGGDFRLANFNGADLTGANLHLADLRLSLMDDATQVTNKWRTVWRLLNDPNYPLDLQQMNLTNVALRGASWTNINFGGANLASSSLFQTIARDCIFTNANLSDTDLERCDFSGSNLTRALLRRAQGGNIQFVSANLASANLDSASLMDANFGGADLTATILRNCNLLRADFSGASLTNASFVGATLTGVNFTNAKFSNTIMANGTRRNE
jgi:uncharacterized protein YjbI with pentapeptide repeats